MKEEGCREGEAVVEVFVVLHERREVRRRVLVVVVVVVVRHVVPAEANRERRRASMTGWRSSNPEVPEPAQKVFATMWKDGLAIRATKGVEMV